MNSLAVTLLSANILLPCWQNRQYINLHVYKNKIICISIWQSLVYPWDYIIHDKFSILLRFIQKLVVETRVDLWNNEKLKNSKQALRDLGLQMGSAVLAILCNLYIVGNNNLNSVTVNKYVRLLEQREQLQNTGPPHLHVSEAFVERSI